ncbi:hypothetical protein F7725_022444 [Dissostichus mawsoni]|uniref:Uncharacterized protein n=1 Tax=Dissostichus mawsoni TaxID=36200 RepID=A0A7J5Z021_DISMA|nr:hypothetical protein F7725_022444 [Dissostichus mawsoni]
MGSARRRAPPSAEPASCATGCAGKQRLRARYQTRKQGPGFRVFFCSHGPPRSRAQGREADSIEEERESRPDVKPRAAGAKRRNVVHAVDVLVVEEVRGLHEALVTQVAFERAVRRVFVRSSVAHQCVLLLEAHLALVTVEGTLLRVCALVLPEVRRTLETFTARGAAERPGTLRMAGVVEKLRRLFEVQLA